MADKEGYVKRRKGEVSTASTHIRFDDDALSATEETPSHAQEMSSTSIAACRPSLSAPSSKPSNNKRRKRQRRATASTDEVAGTKVLNGLIVAISTLESKSKQTDAGDEYQNQRQLKESLQSMGAIVSPQVHKRVHYLIATNAAVQNLTQRVRQALKRNVDIVDVAWLKECVEKSARVDANNHLCNELARDLLAEKEREKRETEKAEGLGSKFDEEGDRDVPETGWSTPVQLDCCCVCHENGDDNCSWCHDCNLTLERKAKSVQNKG